MPEARPIVPMTRSEVHERIVEIRQGLRGSIDLFLETVEKIQDFKNRDGWRVLGYSSWAECAATEFSVGWRQLYRIFQAGRVAQELCTGGADIQVVIEKHMRELAKLPTAEMRLEVYKEAAADGEITAPRLRELVQQAQAMHVAAGHPSPKPAGRDRSPGFALREIRLRELKRLFKRLRKIMAGFPDVAERAGGLIDELLELVRGA